MSTCPTGSRASRVGLSLAKTFVGLEVASPVPQGRWPETTARGSEIAKNRAAAGKDSVTRPNLLKSRSPLPNHKNVDQEATQSFCLWGMGSTIGRWGSANAWLTSSPVLLSLP